jgi:hypothetical protein
MTGTTEHLRVSEAILKIVQDFPHERIRLKDLMDGLGERSFGFLLLIFGIACAIAPPGFATIFSMPLILFALQMVAGFDSPWLPRSIGERSFAKTDLEKTPKYKELGLYRASYEVFTGDGELVLYCEHIQTVKYRDPAAFAHLVAKA